MSDTLHRLTYDATIDDCTDVSLRLANRTRAFRNQVRLTTALGGALGGLSFAGTLLFFGIASSANGALLSLVGGILLGIPFAFIFLRGYFQSQIRKEHRKVVAEQFGGKSTIQSEIELRGDAVWVRQAGMEMVFPWAVCTGVNNNPADIEINFTLGMCIVRNRHFASPAEQQAFLETARRLWNATNPTNPPDPA